MGRADFHGEYQGDALYKGPMKRRVVQKGRGREASTTLPTVSGTRGGRDQFFENKAIRARNWREMGNETEFETRNGKRCTEFETSNGRKWETRRYKINHFNEKQEKRKKKGKTGGKNTKKAGKKQG